jgi:hypothetical protein
MPDFLMKIPMSTYCLPYCLVYIKGMTDMRQELQLSRTTEEKSVLLPQTFPNKTQLKKFLYIMSQAFYFAEYLNFTYIYMPYTF